MKDLECALLRGGAYRHQERFSIHLDMFGSSTWIKQLLRWKQWMQIKSLNAFQIIHFVWQNVRNFFRGIKIGSSQVITICQSFDWILKLKLTPDPKPSVHMKRFRPDYGLRLRNFFQAHGNPYNIMEMKLK